MAEDRVREAVENEGISFVGPNSRVIQQAGSKDEAKHCQITEPFRSR
ncbi:MAG: hypothetical protein CM1200mP28_12450 [Deltaproteobacteria bacterium]|nr:MAG: hypothetical protein CM1200mP28_12450 [Deltaproteobacteria bacterium]